MPIGGLMVLESAVHVDSYSRHAHLSQLAHQALPAQLVCTGMLEARQQSPKLPVVSTVCKPLCH